MTAERRFGFSLLELLIVMGIIAVLLGVALPNYMNIREKARDTKRKEEIRHLKNALRLFYNDYTVYPLSAATDNEVYGCGVHADSQCSAVCSNMFAAGGSGCDTMYMRELPNINGTKTYSYFMCPGRDDFRLITTLENKSDRDIPASKARCPAACGAVYGATDFVMCADG